MEELAARRAAVPGDTKLVTGKNAYKDVSIYDNKRNIN
jgi:hypothetical protein